MSDAAADGLRFRVLHRLLQVSAGSRQFDEVVDAVVDGLCEALDAVSVSVLLRTGEVELHVAAERGVPVLGPAVEFLSDLTPFPPIAAALREGHPCWVDGGEGGALPAAAGSAGVVPLVTGHTVVGAVVVLLASRRPVPLEDRQLVDSAATVLAERVGVRRLWDEQQRASVQRLALHTATEAFARSETAQQTLEIMLEAIRDLVGPTGWAGAALFDEDGVVRVTRLEPATRTFQRYTLDPDSPRFAMAAVIRDGKARYFRSRDELLAEFPAYETQLSWDCGAIEPIVVGTRTVGALSLVYRAPHRLGEADRMLLSSLATLCGEGLRRLELRDVVQQSNQRSAALRRATEAFSRSATVDEVMDAAITALVEGLAADEAAALVVETDQRERRWCRLGTGTDGDGDGDRHGPSPDALERAVLADGLVRFVPADGPGDPTGPHVAAAGNHGAVGLLPLLVDGRPAGLLRVRHRATRGADFGDRVFAEALATLCGEALHRARLFEQEQRSVARLRALHRLTEALAGATTAQDVFSVAVDEITATLAASAVAVTELRDGAVHVVHAVGLGPDGRLVDVAPPPEFPAPPAVVDALRDGRARWYDATDPALTPWGSGAVLPLVLDGEPVAAFGLAFVQEGAISPADRELLLSVTDLCQEALRRARDLEAVTHAAARYEELFTSYEGLFRTHPQPILVRSEDGRHILAANEALLDALGYGEAELSGRRADDLFTPDSDADSDADADADGVASSAVAAPVPGLVRVARRDGSTFVAETWSGEVFVFGGQPARMVLLVDQTARVQAEDDRRRLQERVTMVAADARRRLAGDLHDGPVQRLAAVALRVEGLHRLAERGIAPPAARLEVVSDEVRRTVEELRTLMLQLYPPAFETLSLGEVLRVITAEGVPAVDGGDAGPAVRLDDRLARPVPDAVKTALFRVAQEALLNVAKHARARTVVIELFDDDGTVVLRIADDGVGIDEATGAAPGHLGIPAMVDRMSLIGGRCLVFRAGTGGTAVEARVPVPVDGTTGVPDAGAALP